MAGDSPRVSIVRQQEYDLAMQDYVPVVLPTDTLKVRRVLSGAHAATMFYRRTFGGGTRAMVTRLTISRRGGTPSAAAGKILLIDRSGTFDELYVASDGIYEALGERSSPVMTLQGSFRAQLGSQAGGSMAFSYEAIVHRFGTETVSA